MTKIADAQNFLDINGLNDIRVQANATDQAEKDVALKKAAKQFEAIFMQMLLKSMRSAQEVLESDSPFNSQSTKFYRDMHDQQLALEMSDQGSLGLAELIERQLGGDSDNFTPSSVLRLDQIRLQDRAYVVPQADEDILTDEKESQAAASIDEKKEQHFSTPQDFVSALIEPAKKVTEKLSLPFPVVIAQAALETGWGQKIIKTAKGDSSNNLFNIKADSRWQGDKTYKQTLEFENNTMVQKREPFRVYGQLEDSLDDYVNFLTSNPRYQGALQKVNDVEQYLQGLQSAGYATDPNYADKILSTLKTVTGILSK